jgi:hypothetical protein
MAEYKVLITTSGTGSRLGDLTKYTNKALVRIGQKPALSYIIEHYSPDAEFVITLGHKGHLIREFLQLAYPNGKFTFVEVPVYEGPGSSLGYSMSCAKPHLQCPFVLHVSDTILTEGYPQPAWEDPWTENELMAGPSRNNAHYRTVKHQRHLLLEIQEKGSLQDDPTHLGVLWVKEFADFWDTLDSLLLTGLYGSDLSDAHVINAMTSKWMVRLIYDFMDVWNVEGLREARSRVRDQMVSLDKVDQATFLMGDGVI